MAQDLAGVAARAWEKHGMVPVDLFGKLTPSQFLALFAKPAGANRLDRLEQLIQFNDREGEKGRRPSLPSWL